ncbi:MAG: patatin-like phospholipase family protein [Caldilineales bacterium]|nr:patatin-like phospholipase family protein [Caldilineales bacterium]
MTMEGRVQKRLGLALGGGGSRGLAHVGVLQVLHEAGVRVDAVAGTSVGSILGYALAAGKSVDEITELSRTINWFHLARLTLPSRGFISFDSMEKYLIRKIGDYTFDQLTMPFVCIGTNALTGEEHEFCMGRVAPCVRASSSVPPLVTPIAIDGQVYVDGGMVNNLPIRPVRKLGVDIVLAVNLFGPPTHIPTGFMAYFTTILGYALCKAGDDPASADVLVLPDLTGYGMFMFHRKASIARGRAAMEAKLPELQAILYTEETAAVDPAPVEIL